MEPVAPQFRGRVAQRVLVVEPEVEGVLTHGELVGRGLEPAFQIVLERGHRLRRLFHRRPQRVALLRRAVRDRRPDAPHQQQPAFVDPQGRLDEDPHRLDQRGARVVEQPGHVLEAPDHGAHPVGVLPVTTPQQEVQPAEQMVQPERRAACLRPLALEPLQRHADVVQEGGPVDLVFQPVGGRLFQGGGEGLERDEMGSERGRAVAPVAIVVGLHAGLRSRDRIEMPPQIEVCLLDLVERPYRHAACLSSRWHSSSDSTRSVRFAASNRTRHAPSSSAS